MKYPFRFTDDYIADIDQIVSAELINDKLAVLLEYKNNDGCVVDFSNKDQCQATFELFCKACTQCAMQRQIEGDR